MNKFMSEAEIKELSNVKGFSLSDQEKANFYDFKGLNPIYVKLANEITAHIDSLSLNINKTKKYTNICRIGKYT